MINHLISIDQYNKNGVAVIRNVISSYWLKKLSIGIEKNFKNHVETLVVFLVALQIPVRIFYLSTDKLLPK